MATGQGLGIVVALLCVASAPTVGAPLSRKNCEMLATADASLARQLRDLVAQRRSGWTEHDLRGSADGELLRKANEAALARDVHFEAVKQYADALDALVAQYRRCAR